MMNRRQFVGGASILSAGGFLLYAQTSEEKIADLEQVTSQLDARVGALETQVAALSGTDGAGGEATGPAGPDGPATVSGNGVMVSEKFALEPGRYRVNATLEIAEQIAGFIVMMYGPSGYEEYLFNELIQTSGTWEGSTVVNVPVSGEYFVEVSNTTAAWTLTFESF